MENGYNGKIFWDEEVRRRTVEFNDWKQTNWALSPLPPLLPNSFQEMFRKPGTCKIKRYRMFQKLLLPCECHIKIWITAEQKHRTTDIIVKIWVWYSVLERSDRSRCGEAKRSQFLHESSTAEIILCLYGGVWWPSMRGTKWKHFKNKVEMLRLSCTFQ